MQDRLRLTEERITAMAEGIRQVAFTRSNGEVDKMWRNEAGLLVGNNACL